ncbi:pseudaminic acid cytidylyltransferase [Algoriphagus resistens]|uniref:pseudaminic acid cytidylyltransferase n=1 Tax=Algoriphagus resistens TaxID=1750590 RepID=UPI0007168FA3|nr:pseudaminic acid cytidylyltransferase [Algoriphagus resistens]
MSASTPGKKLCIIPARGGSKRIPRKNIKDFLGKPIIAYSIEAALNSGLFDEVMVSTDDQEIAKIALKYGAKVPFLRSSIAASDFATLAEAIEDVKINYEQLGISFQYICCLLPTAPLVNTEIIFRGFEELISNSVDSVRPVVQFSYPIQRALRVKNGKISFFYPENMSIRSQDLEPAFHDAGMLYWMKYNVGLKGDNKYGFEISGDCAQDIDNETDWKLAELKFKLMGSRK